jgi:shikimate dehydrogenase
MSAPETLTLASLEQASFTGPQLGVLGDPITHSLSPAMHGAAIAALGNTLPPELRGLRYHRLHITAAELPRALALLHAKGFLGVNLTVPHKIQALDLVESLSDVARRAQSVNTLLRTERGWRGDSTDGAGFFSALREHSGADIGERELVILGAGGAARAIAAEYIGGRAPASVRLRIGNRDARKAADLIQSLGHGRAEALADLSPVSDTAVIVNCTTLGLKESDPSPLPSALLRPGQFVFDTTYGPHVSRLLRDARAAGARGSDGRPMLRWQGALAFRLWTGILPPFPPMRAAIGEPTP